MPFNVISQTVCGDDTITLYQDENGLCRVAQIAHPAQPDESVIYVGEFESLEGASVMYCYRVVSLHSAHLENPPIQDVAEMLRKVTDVRHGR